MTELELPHARLAKDHLNWTLAFGDGNRTAGSGLPANVTHAYRLGGNLTAALVVTDGHANATASLLLRIKDEVGCALLVIEHDMPLITSISHRLIALELGHVVTAGLPDEVVRHPAVVASYLGTDERAIQRSNA